MIRNPLLLLLFLSLILTGSRNDPAAAEDELEAGDPIAAIDGEPIYLGELNLILAERFKTRDLESIPLDVQRAAATLLVRRHLAMKTLKAQGGDLLQGMIRRQLDAFAAEAKRRGSSMEEQARARMSNATSLAADLAWRVAWGQYLKSKMTDDNLRRFFESHKQVYGGNRYEVSQIFVKMDMQDRVSTQALEDNLAALAKEIRASDAPASAFADAARQHSESPAAPQGGHLGIVENDGDLPGPVMQAVRSTPAGQVSEPIRGPSGLHLVFVHRVEPGNRSFEDLTDQAALRRDAADALFNALVAAQAEAKVVWFIPVLKPPMEGRPPQERPADVDER